MNETIKPGWYRDPFGEKGKLRYWDGENWTQMTQDDETKRASRKTSSGLSTGFLILAFIIAFIAFIYNLYFVWDLWGVIGIVVGVVLFPAVLAATPFIALIQYHELLPLILLVVYAVLIFLSFLFGVKAEKPLDS